MVCECWLDALLKNVMIRRGWSFSLSWWIIISLFIRLHPGLPHRSSIAIINQSSSIPTLSPLSSDSLSKSFQYCRHRKVWRPSGFPLWDLSLRSCQSSAPWNLRIRWLPSPLGRLQRSSFWLPPSWVRSRGRAWRLWVPWRRYSLNKDSSTNSVGVEEIEGLFDFLFLLFCEFVPGLAGGLERGLLFFECGHVFTNLNNNLW